MGLAGTHNEDVSDSLLVSCNSLGVAVHFEVTASDVEPGFAVVRVLLKRLFEKAKSLFVVLSYALYSPNRKL